MFRLPLYVAILSLCLAQVFAQNPQIYPGGVVNPATNIGEVSPGSLIVIYGSGLATTISAATAGPWPTGLGGTQVFVNGMAAPLFFVTPSQISAQIPWEANTAVALNIRVSVNGISSNSVPVRSTTWAPGIFSIGSGQAFVLTADGSLAAPSGTFPGARPVRPGESISIFAIGLGTVTNDRPASGAVTPSQPLSNARTNPTVTIGGLTATRTFSGLAPGLVGFWRIDALVPPNTPGGDAVPMVVNNPGFYVANTTTIAVAAPPPAGVPKPSIDSFTPASGPPGSIVTISGTELTLVSTVKFNGMVSPNVGTLSDSLITALVPTGAATGPISVITMGGAAATTTSFSVTPAVAPKITSFAPLHGPSGTSMTITGTGFLGASAVTVNGVLALFDVDSDTSITAEVQDGSSTGSIAVTTSGGTDVSGMNFVVEPLAEDGPPGPVNFIAIDPKTPTTLYATTGIGVFKSIDAGGTWSPANVGLVETIGPLAIDPSNPSTLYAGADAGQIGIYKSSDGGASWMPSSSGVPPLTVVRAIVVDPSNPSTIYAARVGTGTGVLKSTDRGTSWIAINKGLSSSTHVLAFAVDPSNPQTLYAGTHNDGLFKSTDGGANWNAVNNGIAEVDIFAIAVDPIDSATVYAATFGSGIFKSTDGGRNWVTANRGLPSPVPATNTLAIDYSDHSTIYAATLGGVFKSTDAALSWTRVFSEGGTIAIDPVNPSTLYAGTSNGVFKSIDAGASWIPVNNGLSQPLPEVDTLAIDPLHPSTLYAGFDPGGKVMKSTDGGTTWTEADKGIPSGTQFVHDLKIDPSSPSTIYAGTGSGVFKSTDGGLSWFAANNGLPSYAFTVPVLAIDPSHSAIIYAGTGFGIFKSTNGGTTWTATGTLSNGSVRSFAINPGDPSIVFAGTFPNPLFKTANGGATWMAVSSGLPQQILEAFALVFDPAHPSTIYVGTVRNTIFKSTDGGVTWAALHNGLPPPTSLVPIQQLAVDPANTSTIYAGTTAGMYKSIDGGATWFAVNDGLTDTGISALAMDPSNSSTLYVGTDSGTVFKSTDGGMSWQRTGL